MPRLGPMFCISGETMPGGLGKWGGVVSVGPSGPGAELWP